jgi:GNAT superfamily N-acetyltransferase
VDIRDIGPSEVEAARALLEATGWTDRVSDPDEFRELLSRSSRSIVAVEDGEVIGFLRALTDGMTNGYISMLVVAEMHRRKGVGRKLVRAIMGNNRNMTWVLRAGGTAQLSSTSGSDSFGRKSQWSVLVSKAMTPNHAFNRPLPAALCARRAAG